MSEISGNDIRIYWYAHHGELMKVMTIFHINSALYSGSPSRLCLPSRTYIILHTNQMQKITLKESHLEHANLISAAWIYLTNNKQNLGLQGDYVNWIQCLSVCCI